MKETIVPSLCNTIPSLHCVFNLTRYLSSFSFSHQCVEGAVQVCGLHCASLQVGKRSPTAGLLHRSECHANGVCVCVHVHVCMCVNCSSVVVRTYVCRFWVRLPWKISLVPLGLSLGLSSPPSLLCQCLETILKPQVRLCFLPPLSHSLFLPSFLSSFTHSSFPPSFPHSLTHSSFPPSSFHPMKVRLQRITLLHRCLTSAFSRTH